MTVMNIVEFLEARIAEDVEKAASLLAATQDGYDINEYAERMLAECGAKSFIIGLYRTYAKVASERTGAMAIGPEIGRDVTHDALRVLSVVYKNHPDYQQDWIG